MSIYLTLVNNTLLFGEYFDVSNDYISSILTLFLFISDNYISMLSRSIKVN